MKIDSIHNSDGGSPLDLDGSTSQLARRPRRRWITAALRWVIMLVVVFGVGRRIWLEKEKISFYGLDLAWGWLLVSAACYLAGLAACAVFWWLAMRDRGRGPGWSRTLASYYAGHLGKYVPGKMLAVVIRATMVGRSGVGIATGAITCVHEALLTMATGSLVAVASLLMVSIPHHKYWLLASAVLAAGFGLLALPPIVTRLGRLAVRPFPNAVVDDKHSCRWRTFGAGTAMITGGWLLMGLSLAAVLGAMHKLVKLISQLGLWKAYGLVAGLVALASVGGFVSLTPGGLGTREWILVETLGPVVGTGPSVVAVVLLRIVWIVAEVFASGLFWIIDRQWNQGKVHPS